MSIYNENISETELMAINRALHQAGFENPTLLGQVESALKELHRLRVQVPAPDVSEVLRLEDELRDAEICVRLGAAELRKHRAKVALDEARAGR